MTTSTSPQTGFKPVIEPHTQQWLDELAASAGSPPLWQLSPGDARQLLRYVQASVPVRLQPADIDDRGIPGGPTGQVSIRIIRRLPISGVQRPPFATLGSQEVGGRTLALRQHR